jgi:hypothetical protein
MKLHSFNGKDFQEVTSQELKYWDGQKWVSPLTYRFWDGQKWCIAWTNSEEPIND